MENQCTPTYSTLWNKGFLALMTADLLLCVSCYMSIPFLPHTLAQIHADSTPHAAVAIIAFVVGMFASGCFCSWLIQRFRRNTVFLVSALLFGLLQVGFLSLEESVLPIPKHLFTALLYCTLFIAGAAFGLAKRTLSCTLLIDKAESHHRTEANQLAATMSRLAIAVGPLLFFFLRDSIAPWWRHTLCIALIIMTLLLVLTQKFPFRAPEDDTKVISTDRFFLPQGWKVFVGISCTTLSFGIIMPLQTNASFYIFLLLGFFFSLGLQHYLSASSGKRSFIIGDLLVLTASAMLVFPLSHYFFTFIAALILGVGLGTACSCQLSRLLCLCNHCQRSTAVSTYFLACDGGFFLGLAISFLFPREPQQAAIAITALCCIAIIASTKGKNPTETSKQKDNDNRL